MKKITKKLNLILAVFIMFFSLLPDSVSAISSYDNAYNTTSHIYASGASCSLQDLTATYESYILDSSTWVLPASIMQPVKDGYLNALDEDGRVGVSMRTNYGAQQSSTIIREVFVFWNTNDSLELLWWGNANVSALVHNYVSITCLDNVAGGYGKIGVASANTNSGNYMAAPVSNNLPETFSPYVAVDRNLLVNSSAPNYPVGYEGEGIYSGPTKTLYTGTVDCGGEDPYYVGINQLGNSGAATMTPLSLGRASWSYDFTDEPYSITVGCGDTPVSSLGSVSPLPPTSHDWVCNTIDDPPYCVSS